MLQACQVLGGIVLLCGGANWLVLGASNLAATFGVPRYIVGLTLVAMGTSAPEFFVNVLAAFRGQTDFALANVSGSNLANLCVGFGLCALVANLKISRRQFGSDVTLGWVAALTALALMFTNEQNTLPLAGIIPLSVLLLYYLISLRGRIDDEAPLVASRGVVGSLLQFAGGVIGLYAGGELMLDAALDFARILQMPEEVIGLTILAIGTSVPDISASVVASRQGEHGIAIGNLLGSNISNLVVILNATLLACLRPIATNAGIRTDYLAVIVVSMLFALLVFRYERVSRWSGIVMLVGYVGYLASRVIML